MNDYQALLDFFLFIKQIPDGKAMTKCFDATSKEAGYAL